jgi:homocysteine S-methyltransferase
MKRERQPLPPASGRLFLTDAGLETDPDLGGGTRGEGIAPHALLAHSAGRYALARYFRGYLSLTRRLASGYVLDSPTAKAHACWAAALGATEAELHKANRDAVDFIADLRDEFLSDKGPIVLNGVIGHYCDATAAPASAPAMTTSEADDYYGQQIGWLAQSDVDMLTASGLHDAAEAIGIVKAARSAEVPIVLSFDIRADALLPSGRHLCDVITEIDAATRLAAAYYTIGCASTDQLRSVFGNADTLRRIKALRCIEVPHGASNGAPADRAAARNPQCPLELYRRITMTMPWVNIVGGRF